MMTILDRIITDKRRWLQQRKKQQPLAHFIHKITLNDRDFYQSLQRSENAFILECKKASPSKGVIRVDFNPADIATQYRPYASAISVLTDTPYFQGDYRHLTEVSQVVSQPVLCKDFIIDAYQIYLARYYQANAILLILALLNDEQYRQFSLIAKQLNMGILTEVSHQQELERALQLGAEIIGINNRNLHDFSVDINRTKQLASQITDERTLIISESGIMSHHQIMELSPFVNGFLVGSALMAESDLTIAIKSLLFGTNKICGLTRLADAKAAYEAGAIYGGVIFAQDSARCLTIEQAQTLTCQVPLQWVGVFRDESLKEIIAIAQQLSLAAVQIHRQETKENLAYLRQHLPLQCQIWQAISMPSDPIPHQSPFVAHYLLDNGQGGSGRPFDWQLLTHLTTDSMILAGGLSLDNIAQALTTRYFAFDFNSGLESAPGIKDVKKIQALFQYLQQNQRRVGMRSCVN